MSTEELLSPLLDIIIDSTRQLQSALKDANLPEPWLSKSELHPWDEQAPPQKYWDARKKLTSALVMMRAVIQNPREKVICSSTLYHHGITLNFVTKARIPDILGGDDVDQVNGMHVDELSRKTGISPTKLAFVMRYLCNYHIFEERQPNSFANNRHSIALKEDEPARGFPHTWPDLHWKAFGEFVSFYSDPVKGWSESRVDSAFAEAYNPKGEPKTLDYWGVLHQPEHEGHRADFAKAMQAMETINGRGGYLDFDWARFDRPGAIFVDAGSGMGQLSHAILPVLQHASWDNQDKPETCQQGVKFFEEKLPEALTSKRVAFREHNFFEAQPVKGATLYILANILHNWDEDEALRILENLVAAMTEESTLLVFEVLLSSPLAQHHKPPPERDADAAPNVAPYPLLRDYGSATPWIQHQQLELMTLYNVVDKTLEEYRPLFARAGLDLVQVHHMRKHTNIIELKRKKQG